MRGKLKKIYSADEANMIHGRVHIEAIVEEARVNESSSVVVKFVTEKLFGISMLRPRFYEGAYAINKRGNTQN
jgi:hypothetical protein